MSENAASPGFRAIRYVDADDIEVRLLVPWGSHSGFIPPPSIEFYGRQSPFFYVGEVTQDNPPSSVPSCMTCGGRGYYDTPDSVHSVPCPRCDRVGFTLEDCGGTGEYAS